MDTTSSALVWAQRYDPCGNIFSSALVAAIPALLLLTLIAVFNVRIHLAALSGLAACLAVAIGVYHMPVSAAAASTVVGIGFGIFPIGWLVLNMIFFYQLTVKRGLFDVLRDNLARIAPDPRIQLLLIAFAFGSFLEGMAGFGTPVAITAAILIQLRFPPLKACGLALVANTAPVAFGGLGIPLITLHKYTDLDLLSLSATVGAQLVIFSFAIPFVIVVLLSGWRGLAGVWPAALVAGVSYAAPQYLVSNFNGPWLVAPISAISCIVSIVLLLRVWKPAEPWAYEDGKLGLAPSVAPGTLLPDTRDTRARVFQAWLPWAILTFFILVWALPNSTAFLNKISDPKEPVPYLNHLIEQVPPVVVTKKPADVLFEFNILSATGTGVFLAALVVGLVIGFTPSEFFKLYFETLCKIRLSLLTIFAMMALGTVTGHSGADGTLGLALARSGSAYPFLGTLLGWIGAAITGSDTSSNVLFGSLQKITAQQINVSAVLMCAANTCGGVMGKMISSQSIVVASTATNWYGHEGRILRYVLLPSLILAALMGVLVTLMAYVYPFTLMVGQ